MSPNSRNFSETTFEKLVLGSNRGSTHLNEDVNLRTRIKLRHYGCVECLFEVHRHFYGFPITARPPLPLTGAERGHAVLAVDQRLVMQSFAFAPSYLSNKAAEHIYRVKFG